MKIVNTKITKLFFILLCSINAEYAVAQQWVDKNYSYDSVLNVVYGSATNFNGGTDILTMDIYTPNCNNNTNISQRPLLVWIHGGAFIAGNKDDASITNLCKQFAKRGYVTASINYRLGFVSDDAAWTCNYPNYSCVFAADSAEWYRAYYRAIQDSKGAIRYLINRNALYRIDTNNVFVAGESAGALTALGIGLLDTITERFAQTYALNDVPKPNSNTFSCEHNSGKTFPNPTIPRPDLGSIDGTIEPTTINYTIKGIGSMYGAVMSDVLKHHKANKLKPAIYLFHQPCDIVVPIDSGYVYWGISWCMTNGYNCNAIANTSKLYGSRAILNWNTNNNYGYSIHNEFTTTNFPYSYLIGTASCYDQTNYPCHAYDNSTIRENNLASFFSTLVSTNYDCEPTSTKATSNNNYQMELYPNPTSTFVFIKSAPENSCAYVVDLFGNTLTQPIKCNNSLTEINLEHLSNGCYYLVIKYNDGVKTVKKILKN